MNRTITLLHGLLLAAIFPICLNAQVRLSPNDIYAPGKFSMGIDTMSLMSIGSPGANRTWDFSSLKPLTKFGFNIVPYDGKGNGNEANLAKINGTDTFQYILKSGDDIFNVMPLHDFDLVTYYKQRAFTCPFRYGDVNYDSFVLILYHTGADFGMPAYDSLKINFHMVLHANADAWGRIHLPAGQLDALRVRTETLIQVGMEGKKGSNPYTALPAYDQDEKTLDYIWYARDKGSFVASYDPGQGEMTFMVSAALSVNAASMSANLQFSNPMHNDMQIWNSGAQELRISIYDMNGRLVHVAEIAGHSDIVVNTSGFSQGIYHMEIYNPLTDAVQFMKVLK